MAVPFIGREKEINALNDFLGSRMSEFIVVYGRRRVGKTFLIQHVIGENYAYYAAGIHGATMKEQIKNFVSGLPDKNARPKTWLEAFRNLEQYLEQLPEGRKIIFIDEIPWMDTQRSKFIYGLEHFWNSWASWRDDIKLIVCGSATSWIVNNLINSRGGLHNRVTHQIRLKPFTLRECKLYFAENGFRFSERQIAECYMVMGGVPYYLSKMKKTESVAQNVDRLLFDKDGELHGEFNNLYNSLFKNAGNHMAVVTALATKGKGLTRQEVLDETGLPDNGKIKQIFEELGNCGFIRCYEPFRTHQNRQRRKWNTTHRFTNSLYQLVDPFTLFYFQIMSRPDARDDHFWTKNQNSHIFSTWSGLSFEMLCLNHEEEIKISLGISGISCNIFSWIGSNGQNVAQIDLLIDRSDNVINLCEMKYSSIPYRMSEKDEISIERKIDALIQSTHTDKSIIVTMIAAKGLENNEYSGCIQKQLTLSDLFK
ncbi:MAG: AAA family ATPase [bacterium]|nr:AAA family ATPase [Candidatus Minthenecus merdequi]